MLDLGVGISGRASLQAKLDGLKKKASKAQLEKALRAGGEVFKRAIEERTPVRAPGGSGDALQPGQLKHDIHVKLKSALGRESRVSVGPGSGTAKVMSLLEWGHRIGISKLPTRGRSRGASKVGRFVPPLAIMRGAYESSQDESMRAVIDSLRKDEGE